MPGTIELNNFSKNYGNVRAVDNISLQVNQGELYGLIGPDGAGKTTTMRTICTLLVCEHGEVFVDDLDVRKDIAEIRALIGYMPQRFSLYPDLTVAQNLNFFADLFGVPKEQKQAQLEKLYQFSKLQPFKSRLANALSGGMKQKLALSCTLIHTPKILILDEPTTGVDPVSRREFWQILRKLKEDGVTILVSTPYMDEAELCDRVAFMYRGQILAADKPENLHKYFPNVIYGVTGKNQREVSLFFKENTSAVSVQIFGDRLHVSFEQELSDNDIAEIKKQVSARIDKMEKIKPSIEDTFLALMISGAAK